MKKFIISALATIALLAAVTFFCTNCSNLRGLNRIVNIYSLDGQLIATYEGKIIIDNKINGSVMLELDGKRYMYYNAIVEVIEK